VLPVPSECKVLLLFLLKMTEGNKENALSRTIAAYHIPKVVQANFNQITTAGTNYN
jgi:hypothetical protein